MSDFDLKAGLESYAGKVRKALKAMEVCFDLPHDEKYKEAFEWMSEHGFNELLNEEHPIQVPAESFPAWLKQQESALKALPKDQQKQVKHIVASFNEMTEANTKALEERSQLFNGVFDTAQKSGKAPRARFETFDKILQSALGVVANTEQMVADKVLTEEQAKTITSHALNLAEAEINHFAGLDDGAAKAYRAGESNLAKFSKSVEECSEDNKKFDSLLKHAEEELAKLAKSAEKSAPKGDSKKWIIGGAIAAVVAVGAWMLAVQNEKNDRAATTGTGRS